ncbi:MAG: universal stress protein [Actinobacteria bacterium]|nr:universal stress protein [Actinomycetota bacterium]
MIKKILVPTDGSERAERAADFAIALAKATGASLLFLNVIDEVPPAYAYEVESGAPIDVTAIDDLRQKFGEEAVAKLKDKAAADGVTAETSVVEGHPWQEILTQVESQGADHIVIGSHGRRALAAAVLGNVAVNVIHGAKVPVTVIPLRD